MGFTDKAAERYVSVVVPVKNAENKIGRCLKAMSNQTYKPLEVILVDGHSTDKTTEIASKYAVKIVYEDYGTIGGARQTGIENAKGDYIAFTDADCIPEPNWLNNLMKEFNSDYVGIGGGVKNIGSGLWETSIALALDSFLGSANSVQDRVLSGKKVVKSISGCNGMYRKSDLIKINGFNTKLAINEDTELNKRLIKLGKILYTPNAVVLHKQERSLKGFIKRMYVFGHSRGKNRLWDLQVIPPILALFTVVSLFLSLKAFSLMIIAYLLIVLSFDIHIFMSIKKLKYLTSVPIVFFIEHLVYTIGFWIGVIESMVSKNENIFA